MKHQADTETDPKCPFDYTDMWGEKFKFFGKMPKDRTADSYSLSCCLHHQRVICVILTRQLQHEIRTLPPESGRPTQPPPVDSLFHCLSFSSLNPIRPASEVLKILLPVVLRTGICLRGHPVWSVWDAEIAARPKSRIAETESLQP
jgi:hypothetical protein